jgi:glyoxylase-like metal-dependent hydrolase (beta-lactamase superfamily II)
MATGSFFATREHRPGVWLVAAPPHVNCFLVAGTERAILIDTGLGIGDIHRAVRELTDLDVHVVNTHYHWDHSGGNSGFDDIAIHELGAERLQRGPDMTKLEPYAAYSLRMLERVGEFRVTDEEFFGFLSDETTPRPLPDDFDFATWKIPASIPTQLLQDGDRLDLGGRTLQVFHTPGHTPDSICLFDEENGLLFGGDTYNTGPIYAHLLDSDVDAFARSTARMTEIADGVAFVYVAHFSRYVEIGTFLHEVAAGFADVVSGEASFEQSTDDDGEGARLARFARFGVLVPSEHPV